MAHRQDSYGYSYYAAVDAETGRDVSVSLNDQIARTEAEKQGYYFSY